MTAREMFEKANYYFFGTDMLGITFMHKNTLDKIYFSNEDRDYGSDDVIYVDMKLHKAISKQIEELGWLDD